MLRIMIIAVVLSAGAAKAEIVACKALIKGNEINLSYNDDLSDNLWNNYTFREIFFSGWGDYDCPSYVVLRHMTPEVNETERNTFCLQRDEATSDVLGFTFGEQNAYGECKAPSRSFCQFVNDSKVAATAIVTASASAIAGGSTAAGAAGISAVSHSSGAVILTGSSGYIAGTLGTAGATTVSVLTAPAVIAAATVSAVALGGAVYICSE